MGSAARDVPRGRRAPRCAVPRASAGHRKAQALERLSKPPGRGLGPGFVHAAQPPCPGSGRPLEGGGREAAAVGASSSSCRGKGGKAGAEAASEERRPLEEKRNQKGGGGGKEGAEGLGFPAAGLGSLLPSAPRRSGAAAGGKARRAPVALAPGQQAR